jgi:hypothetical protein
VPFHDLFHARQAHAGARELGGCMQSLKGLEQLAGVGGVKASAVVAEVKAVAGGPPGCHPELDRGVVAPGGVLPGVVDQVLQYRADERGVCRGPERLLDGEAHLTVWFLVPVLLRDAGGHCSHV